MIEPADQLPARPGCIACDQRPATGGHLCPGCAHAIPAALHTITTGYPRLDPTPHGPGTAHDQPDGRTGFGPRDGARVTVLALTTPPAGDLHRLPPTDHNHPHDVTVLVTGGSPTPVTSLRAQVPTVDGPRRPELTATVVALGLVADRCREDGLLPPLRGTRTVAGEALRLSDPQVIADIAGRWWAGWAVAVLRRQAAAIRAALGEHEPSVPLGRCPRPVLGLPHLEVADGHTTVVRDREQCPGLVRSREAGHEARCTADAGHRWYGTGSVRALAARLGDAHLDGPALRTYLAGLGHGDISAALLWKWAQLDQWARHRRGRRTLYRLADALTTAQTRRPALGSPVQGTLDAPTPSDPFLVDCVVKIVSGA